MQTRFVDNDKLREIRNNTDWKALFRALGIRKDEKKSKDDDWWGYSPFAQTERTASFHINEKGWFCHSTSRGGGPIELVQRIEEINCYQAGRWLLEHGVSFIVGETRKEVETNVSETVCTHERSEGKTKAPNKAISVDLRKVLSPSHPDTESRGIPASVMQELGAGYLEKSKSPLQGRIVFQVRGLNEIDGELRPVILTHTGRSTNDEQKDEYGKWYIYPGFRKTLELYNIDKLLLDDEARTQTAETGHVVLVEGCYDVAKLWAAGIRNAVATFGAHLSKNQIPRIQMIAEELDVKRFLVFYDRDQTDLGTPKAVKLLTSNGIDGIAFDWSRTFSDRQRGNVVIPDDLSDPCDFSISQLKWFRSRQLL